MAIVSSSNPKILFDPKWRLDQWNGCEDVGKSPDGNLYWPVCRLAGDKVSWNRARGKAVGTVKKQLTAPTKIKGHQVAASPGDPQLLVESAATVRMAAHKPAALKRLRAVKLSQRVSV